MSKCPVRYMSGAFRTKADRELNNYFEMGFQNGGSIVRFEQRAESLFSGFPSPIEPNPGHDTGKRL